MKNFFWEGTFRPATWVIRPQSFYPLHELVLETYNTQNRVEQDAKLLTNKSNGNRFGLLLGLLGPLGAGGQ